MFLFYIILSFGGGLLFYTALSFSRTKKLIVTNRYETSFTKRTLKKIEEKALLWKYYFVNGKPKNLLRNIIITLVIFVTVYLVNMNFIHFDNKIVSLMYFVCFFIFVWKWGQKNNKRAFTQAFPEIIQVLNSATTAGAGVLQALERCGKDVKGSFGDEFKYIYRRLVIGEDVNIVLSDSYSRWPYHEFFAFITILKINLEKGGQMKEVIQRLGRVIANAQKMEQKKKAMTSEARMSAAIVACFPLAFFFFMKLKMPENFEYITTDPLGRLVLYYVLASEFLGMTIIWWLMKRAT